MDHTWFSLLGLLLQQYDMFLALILIHIAKYLHTWCLPILGHHHTILYELNTFRHWFFLVLPLNDMHNVQVDSNDMFAALRATAVPRQLISLDIAGFWATYCISRTSILCGLFLFLYIKHGKKTLSLLPALISHLYLSWGILDAKSSRC